MVVWTLRLGTGGGVLAGLEVAVGRALSDTEEAVYKVSRDVVLIEEALEADPGIISTAFLMGAAICAFLRFSGGGGVTGAAR